LPWSTSALFLIARRGSTDYRSGSLHDVSAVAVLPPQGLRRIANDPRYFDPIEILAASFRALDCGDHHARAAARFAPEE